MSHLLDKLNFFQSKELEQFSDGWGQTTRENRDWEDTYRNRWRHDKIVRSTHGVNCTGSCSWKIYVKSGIVTWETQQTDYPRTRAGLPNHEPRGCARGASYSWYLYSANRVKNPLIRGALMRAWRKMRETMTPVAAWAAIQGDPALRNSINKTRGKGGFVRASWDEATEIIAAANAYTAKTYGPDRVFGFSPIPAMSMVSYAAGSRYLSLLGGTCMSFYDWYCDLPPASPQTWGEQTDVPESADWYNAGFLMLWGSNVPQTRTPDAHFYTEVRYRGTKSAVVSPDYSEAAKFGDIWLNPQAGTDAALAMAMGHVILREFHLDRQAEYFEDYARKYTDMPMLVVLDEQDGRRVPGRMLRADDLDGKLGEANNPDWKTVAYDEVSGRIVAPNGSIGFRWGEEGKWNLEEKAGSAENRGGPVVWMSEVDAAKAGLVDNDWVEAYNTNGALTARVVVSQRIKQGTLFMYHAQEKIVNTPGSEKTGNRGGIHNSVTRATLKPTHMIGGYAQLSYGFNYYGTVGSNRDEFVIVRKMKKIDWLDKPASRSATQNVEAAE